MNKIKHVEEVPEIKKLQIEQKELTQDIENTKTLEVNVTKTNELEVEEVVYQP